MKKVMLSNLLAELQNFISTNGDAEIISIGSICNYNTDEEFRLKVKDATDKENIINIYRK